jgi:hypothetical protein
MQIGTGRTLERGRAADMVRVVVGDQDLADSGRVEAVCPDELEDLIGPRAEAGVDERELVAAVDQVGVAVEAVREVEAVVAAADEVDVLRQLHVRPPGPSRRGR